MRFLLIFLCFVRVFTSEVLVSDEFFFRSLMARNYQLRVARSLETSGGRRLLDPGTAVSTACSMACTTAGTGNYCTRSITSDTSTGIFTGSITTNQCPKYAGAYQFNGVKDNNLPVDQSLPSCVTFTFPVSGYTGPKAAPLRNGMGFTISGGEVIYGPLDAGFTLGQVTINSCGLCPGGTDLKMCAAYIEATCGTKNLRGNTSATMHYFLSDCGGHAGHLHASLACEYSATAAGHSTLVGIMLDGRGLYGLYESTGVKPTDLDACSGHYGPTIATTVGSDTYPAATNVYHYHLTTDAPFVPGCFGPVASLAAANALYPQQCTSSGATCSCTSITTVGSACSCADGTRMSVCTSKGRYTNYIVNCPVYKMGTSSQSQVVTTDSTCVPCEGNCPDPSSSTVTVSTSTPTATATATASATATKGSAAAVNPIPPNPPTLSPIATASATATASSKKNSFTTATVVSQNAPPSTTVRRRGLTVDRASYPDCDSNPVCSYCATWNSTDALVNFGGYLRSHYCTPLGLSVNKCKVSHHTRPDGSVIRYTQDSKINSNAGLPPSECATYLPSRMLFEEEGEGEQTDGEGRRLASESSSFTVNITLGKSESASLERMLSKGSLDSSQTIKNLWAAVLGINVSQVSHKSVSGSRSVKGNFTLSGLPDRAFSGNSLSNETLSLLSTAISTAVDNTDCSVCTPTITKVTVKSTGVVLYSASSGRLLTEARLLPSSNPGEVSVEFSLSAYSLETISSIASSSTPVSFLNALMEAIATDFPTVSVEGATLATATTTTATTTPTSSSTNNTTTTPTSSSTNNNLGIGLGVGLGVGVPVLLLAAHYFYPKTSAAPSSKVPEIHIRTANAPQSI